jgi:citrate lyase subunit gamma (acyl carrier protein)
VSLVEIITSGFAGTLESSDVSIVIKPNTANGILINLDSQVKKQFGEAIIATIKKTLKDLNVKKAIVDVNDKGALDCVIESRVRAAAYRAAQRNDYKWE